MDKASFIEMIIGGGPEAAAEKIAEKITGEIEKKTKERIEQHQAAAREKYGERIALTVELEIESKNSKGLRRFIFDNEQQHTDFIDQLPRMTQQGLIVLGKVKAIDTVVEQQEPVYQAYPVHKILSIQSPAFA